MIHAQTVSAIFCKQVKDVLKNTEVLILFIIYPVVALVMTSAMSSTIGQELFFVSIFGTMHCVFAPIVTTATIISEEKEKNTLRALLMSSVNPLEYLLSIGGFILICTLVTGSSFIFIGGYSGIDAVKLLIFMSIGCILSIVLGMIIGVYAKNMMSANGIAVPLGVLFGFLPMLSAFNEPIKRIADFTFGQQISNLIGNVNDVSVKGLIILLVNLILFMIAFFMVFRKNKLDD